MGAGPSIKPIAPVFAEVPYAVRHFDHHPLPERRASTRSRATRESASFEDLFGLRGGDGAGEPAAEEVGVAAVRDTTADVVGDVEAAPLITLTAGSAACVMAERLVRTRSARASSGSVITGIRTSRARSAATFRPTDEGARLREQFGRFR
jgi:hypothetical protein